LINFNHSEESFFFPNDFFIALVIFIIFISILLIYRHYFKLKHQPSKSSISLNKYEKPANMKNTQKLDLDEKLTILGIILTVIFTGIYPFIQKPLLDYSIVDDFRDDSKFGIKLINRGFDTANDVIISLNSSGNSFKTFTLEPFINHTINHSSSGTSSYVQIDFLPPGSQTILIAELSNPSSSSNTTVTTYVRSQESTGHYDALIKIIFYLSLSVIFGFVFIYLSYWDKLKLKKPDNWKILHERERNSFIYINLIIVSYIVIFSIGYHMLINNSNGTISEYWKFFNYMILSIFIFVLGISIILFIKQEKMLSIKR
jgi:hypothetical protein